MTQSATVFRAGRLRLLALPFALGVLTVLGFAPLYVFFLTPLTLAGLFHLWLHAGSRRAAFRIGLAFGAGMFLVGVSWVYVSMHDFGMMPAPVAALATLVFCLFLALFPAIVGVAQTWLDGPPATRLLFAMPALWAGSEWVRGWIFTGFPWLAVGYSAAPYGPLAGFAPVAGVYGVSLLTAVSAGLLALAHAGWRGGGIRKAAPMLTGCVALWVLGAALQQVSWTRPVGAPVSVSLLQGNIAQDLKWREDRLAPTLATYQALVQQSPGRLIVLPETAIPLFLDQVPAGYLETLADHARRQGGDLILGIAERDPDTAAYYNSAITLGSAVTQRYRKHHLVPFGEFVPLRPLFGWFIDLMQIPLGDFARGPKWQQPLAVAGQRVAVNICYEDVFGEEIIRQLPSATLLVNISNDAWFGESFALGQHLQISQMRALETGRFMLRATNTGITAIIDPRGRVLHALPPHHTDALQGEAQGMMGATPYVRWGNIPFLGVTFGLLLASAWQRRRK